MLFGLRRSIIPAVSLLLGQGSHKIPSWFRNAIAMSSGGSSNENTSAHNETLVRPETAGIPKTTHTDKELVFFNTFFCPYAQMAWVALNEKGMAGRTEFLEGLKIVGGDYEVHPRLAALGRSGVPTLHHPKTETVVDGSTECVEFIDRNFGTPHQLLPSDKELLLRSKRCETLLHSIFTFPFYSMLLRQEPEEQEKAKRNLRAAVEQLVQGYRGPFYLGEQFTVADIAVAPYFDRMIVLEHYRNFTVDEPKWCQWSENVLKRPSVAATRQDRNRIVEAYRRYAECYVRNNWYERVFLRGY